ncbi:MAG: 2-oxo acid dehydrogenase subunit E2 [Acidobacteriaceae bacterium]|nr:2-oxo acid dehydrogenase subunit E2 [Acidobacteriaceae bacterium]
MADFTLPELGENVAAGDVLRILVKPGDVLAKDQPVLELETDKATIEVPSSIAGTVKDVRIKVGDKVKVGQVILSVEAAGGNAAAAPASAPAKTEAPAAKIAAVAAAAPVAVERPAPAVTSHAAAVEASQPDGPMAPASPSVRRLARELGIDIAQVAGSGEDGRISIDDVKAHTKRIVTSGGGAASGATALPHAEPLPDFTRWGAVDRQELRGIRRKTAEHLTAAWLTIPHVTQHDYADLTSLESVRKKYQKQVAAAGGALTVTAVAVKIVAAALKVFPQFNASIDLANNAIIYKKYVNIGVAVDTDRGLLVPVIRDADTKNLTQISVELMQLSEKARTKKITLEEMQGGCFSISNLGGLGGGLFTPIVNAPEVAILGIARGKFQPVYDTETKEFSARQLLPLSLSYDHRVIDGADGVRFLRWVVEAFEQPFAMSLY